MPALASYCLSLHARPPWLQNRYRALAATELLLINGANASIFPVITVDGSEAEDRVTQSIEREGGWGDASLPMPWHGPTPEDIIVSTDFEVGRYRARDTVAV